MYYWLVLRQLSFQVGFKAVNVRLDKIDWSCDIEVVEEVGDMKKYRVTGLPPSSISSVLRDKGAFLPL